MSKELEKKVEDLRVDCEKLRFSVNEILDAGAKEKTILILLSHYTKLPQRTIKQVMDGMHDLELVYFAENDMEG
jgi:hypothetical protein